MPDFDFSDLAVADNPVAPYVLRTRPRVVLRLAIAGERNRPYWNAFLRGMRAAGRGSSVEDIAEDLVEARRRDRVLFAAHVLVGWSGVVDRAGAEVPFSADAAAELLRALPDEVFDLVRRFAKDSTNYTTSAITDAEALAKN